MKAFKLMAALALAMASVASATPSRADWTQLRKGIDENAAVAAVGAPMIASRSKSRMHSTWTYDFGGYVQFEAGRVVHWSAPQLPAGVTELPKMQAVAARSWSPAPKPTGTTRYVIVR